MFTRFSSRLDAATQKMLQRGYRIREMFKQTEHDVITMCDQIAIAFALLGGLLDSFRVDQISDCKKQIRQNFSKKGSVLCQKIEQGNKLSEEDQKMMLDILKQILEGVA